MRKHNQEEKKSVTAQPQKQDTKVETVGIKEYLKEAQRLHPVSLTVIGVIVPAIIGVLVADVKTYRVLLGLLDREILEKSITLDKSRFLKVPVLVALIILLVVLLIRVGVDTYVKKKTRDKDIEKYEQHRLLYEAITKMVDASDNIESVQLYRYSEPKELVDSTEQLVHISVSLAGQYSKQDSIVNVLGNMIYPIDRELLKSILDLSEAYCTYSKETTKKRNKIQEETLIKTSTALASSIANQLAEIKNESQIEEYHYVYYRLIDVLSQFAIGGDISIDLPDLDDKIEMQLRCGRRTGIVGRLFVDSTYFFGNTNSTTKKDRLYACEALDIKGEKYLMMVVVDGNELRIVRNHDRKDRLEEIMKKIKNGISKAYKVS